MMRELGGEMTVALYDMIQKMPLFTHFTEKEKREFAMREHQYLGFEAGGVIVQEGHKSTTMFLLLKGSARVVRGGHEVILARLGPGAVFGELSFLTQRPRFSSVVAEEEVMLLKMDETFFASLHPDMRDKMKNYLIDLLIKRLDAMNESLVRIASFARGRMLT